MAILPENNDYRHGYSRSFADKSYTGKASINKHSEPNYSSDQPSFSNTFNNETFNIQTLDTKPSSPNASSFASAAPIGPVPLREDLGQLNLQKALPKKRQRR